MADRRVLVLGCGALGSYSANQLTRAGVGLIRVIDRDFVELDNLQRQVLFDEDDAAKSLPKAVAAVEKLKRINTSIQLEAEVSDVNPKNVEKLIESFDLVIDGTDNTETRMILNDACVKSGTPWIYGACVSSVGMSMNILPGKGPCLRCLFPDLPPPGSIPTCDTAGIVNTVPAIVASMQVTEAFKVLIGDPDVRRTLIHVDVWKGTFESIRVDRADGCEACDKRDFRYLEAESTSWAQSLCGRNAVQILPQREADIPLDRLRESLSHVGRTSYNGFLLRFEVDRFELTIFPNGRVIVKGTKDASIARSLYARYLGV